MQQVKKNYIYNVLYQLLILIVPLITIPYVSRIIGVEGTGIYSYTYSIAYYFMLFALLGINNYGNRTIAKKRDNKEEMSQNFWEIYIIQIVSSIIMIFLYYMYVLLFDNEYSKFALLQSFYVISSIFDITWFFNGIEEFKIILIRNGIVKIIGMFLILLLVKTKNDLDIYISILSITTLIGQFIVLPTLKKYIVITRIKNIRKHIKPILKLFIPVIAVSLYKVMDKIMLGILSNMQEVGYYENAERIINIPIILISCLGTVMLPKSSNMIANSKEDEVKKSISNSVYFQMFMSLPITIGLILISDKFINIYLGQAFQKSALLTIVLAITIPFLSLQTVYKMQYIIPKERDKDYIIATVLGAIVNLILNLILIPILQSFGASIATLIAEFVAMLYIILSVRKDINIMSDLKLIIPLIAKAFVMGMFVYLVNFINIENSILILITQVLVGIIIYFVLNYKYIIRTINFKRR